MNETKWYNRPVTWGAYWKLCGVSFVIGCIAMVPYVVYTVFDGFDGLVETIKDKFKKEEET